MNTHDHRKQLTNSARAAVALCALAALGGRAAQAQFTFVGSPGGLSNTVQTSPFPMGDASGFVPTSFTVAAGTNNVTFTASKNVNGIGFESAIANQNDGPQFTPNDRIENAFVSVTDASGNTTNQITGPITISFQTGVTGFGLFAQDANSDTEQFTLTLFNGTTQVGSVMSPTQDNFSTPRGNAVFVGVQSNVAGAPLITSAILSSSSFATGTGGNPTNGSNDFFFGPAQVQAPVPEASTMVSFGMGVLLFAGLAIGGHRRKVNGAS